jgi:hypothetical protein
VKALRVLSRERRTGETLYDCVEAIAGDAHNWRGIVDHNGAQLSTDQLLWNVSGKTVGEICGTEDVQAFVEKHGFEKSTVIPQPPPVNGPGPALWPIIISELGDSETDELLATDMQARDDFGRAKYGVPLVASNGRDHLADAYQEALDFVVYLRAAFDKDAQDCHERTKIIPCRVVGEDVVEWKMYSNGSKIHALYLDAIDMARDVRELIRERDGK